MRVSVHAHQAGAVPAFTIMAKAAPAETDPERLEGDGSQPQAAAVRRSRTGGFVQHRVQQGMLCAPFADRTAAELRTQGASCRLLLMCGTGHVNNSPKTQFQFLNGTATVKCCVVLRLRASTEQRRSSRPTPT